MTSVSVDLHRDLGVEEQQKHARLSGAWTATLLAVAGIAVTAMWIALFFMGLPYLAHLGR